MLKFGGSLDRVVTVSMPRSLPELQHQAAQHFGHSGCLRLYHQGATLLYNPAQMKQVKDGDVIIVRRSEIHRPTTAPETPLSTHQADFKRRPFQRPASEFNRDSANYESILTERTKGVPLDGMSRYAMDFVPHPIETPVPFKPPNALAQISEEKLGPSTYSQEFPWRAITKQSKALDDQAVRESSLSLASQQEPFKGVSSYTIDYPRRSYVSPRELALAPSLLFETSAKPLPTPFCAVSTYSTDFRKVTKPRTRSFRPKGDSHNWNEPFQGTSEYRRSYQEHDLTSDRSEFIKLATEAFEAKDADSMRKAAEEAVRMGGVPIELEVPA